MSFGRQISWRITVPAIALVVLVLAVVGATLGEITAIKGSYVLLGLLLAVGLRAGSTRVRSRALPEVPDRLLGKAAYAVLLAALLSALLTDARLFALLVCLPLGYGLVGLQLASRPSPRWLLPQITALFTVGPVTKYLTTGTYFGNGDTLKHVGYVDQLVATGGIEVLSRYVLFPGLHILAGSVDLVTALSPYDSLLAVGIVTYTVLVPLVYLLAVTITGNARFALFTATALAALEPVSLFSTYFFPQSLAVALLLFVLYISYRMRAWTGNRGTAVALTLPIAGAAVVTHHLTFIMFVPVLGLVLVAPVLLRRFDATRSMGRAVCRPDVLPLAVGWGGALAYWLFFNQFITDFVWSVGVVLSDTLLAGDVGKPAKFFTYGMDVPAPTIESAVASLGSPTGVYAIVLVALTVVAVGSPAKVVNDRVVRRSLAVLLAGLAFTPFVLPTPIALPGIDRFQLVLSFFFAFVVGLGLYVLSSYTPTARSSGAVLTVVVVVLGASGALVAADDVAQVQRGPGLTDLQPSPGPQVAFSDGEYAALDRTSGFVRRYDPNVSTFWISRWTLARFGADANGNVDISERGLGVGEGAFLYRQRWAQHEVLEISDGGLSYTSMRFSDAYLTDNARTENRIYSTGRTGLLWFDSETVLED